MSGDPFVICVRLPAPPVDPCSPSPCGPFSACRVFNEQAVCSCVEGYVGYPPNCRPECSINPDCASDRACNNFKCVDPCAGACGANAACRTTQHVALCTCLPGYTGDPFQNCVEEPRRVELVTEPPVNPCGPPSPCGANAKCIERNGAGSCVCLKDYFGDPRTGCRPECVQNSGMSLQNFVKLIICWQWQIFIDCPYYQSCQAYKCKDPCIGSCGVNSDCRVQNHLPLCQCHPGYTGNGVTGCTKIPPPPVVPQDPCRGPVCGPYSQCRNVNDVAVCSCLAGYVGSPPFCKPECVSSSECSLEKACRNEKCVDPVSIMLFCLKIKIGWKKILFCSVQKLPVLHWLDVTSSNIVPFVAAHLITLGIHSHDVFPNRQRHHHLWDMMTMNV